MAYSGKFLPKNPSKYIGDVNKITYRSLWERRVMRYFDETDAVVAWGSEEFNIPYRSPVDNRMHRYFPDFIVKVRSRTGEIKTLVVEVKPLSQSSAPAVQKKITKRYITEVMRWGVNEAKWKAAKEFCDDRKWEFQVWTEKTLGIKG